jgi:hypothetical protein
MMNGLARNEEISANPFQGSRGAEEDSAPTESLGLGIGAGSRGAQMGGGEAKQAGTDPDTKRNGRLSNQRLHIFLRLNHDPENRCSSPQRS